MFVDAGYVLADGAMAVHGTSRRESVSWDYSALLQFFADLAADRTGLPLLRCYWYEATVEGRRTPEHDTLADLAGLKLRLGRMRPGKREGVETEIHRDLTTLARNHAISDVLLVSAEEDLSQVIADVQDLGVRVIIVHISVDGNWTMSRSLRQQCDDIVEIDGAQLRPYVELVVGAEPSRYGEQYTASAYSGKPSSNGHGASQSASGSHQALFAGSPGSYPAPPAIYTAPVVADYEAPLQPSNGNHADYTARPQAPQSEPALTADPGPAEAPGAGAHGGHGTPGAHGAHAAGSQSAQLPWPAVPPPGPPLYSAPAASSFRGEQAAPAAPDLPQAQLPPASSRNSGPSALAAPQGTSGPMQSLTGPPSSGPSGQRPSSSLSPYEPAQPGAFADGPPGSFPSAPPDQFSTGPSGLVGPPARRGAQSPGAQGIGSHGAGSHGQRSHGQGSQGPGPQGNGSHAQRSPLPSRSPQAPRTQPARRPGESRGPGPASRTGLVPQQGPYSPALPGRPAGSPVTVSLGDAVQAAHAEGFEFGESVAREAPALWLEAVLARKPRMPSDLEARLLQGSALPIDSLLHDEVRHALRRGFWDALEHSRR
ncbi:MAG TPA: NYN domain-containing protein [Streptosporangiaceae bacterium]